MDPIRHLPSTKAKARQLALSRVARRGSCRGDPLSAAIASLEKEK